MHLSLRGRCYGGIRRAGILSSSVALHVGSCVPMMRLLVLRVIGHIRNVMRYALPERVRREPQVRD